MDSIDKNEFRKYAVKHHRINSLQVDKYISNFDRSRMASGIATNLPMDYTPYIIEERQLNISQLDVFSRLMMDRIIFLGDPIYDQNANVIQAQLLFLQSAESTREIQLYINSPGGSVYAGLGIYDTMQLISNDVATICTGMAASMGAVLLCAGAEGKRAALPHSRVMIHQPSGGAQGQQSDIEISYHEITKLKKELYQIIADHSGASFEKVEKSSDRDYWMIAEEAKEFGMVDEILRGNGKASKQ